MKLKLNLTLLFALVSSFANAATPNTNNTVSVNSGKGTFDFSTDKQGTVTSTFVGERGSDKTFAGDNPSSKTAAGAITALHKTYVNADGIAHKASNTILTLGNENGTTTTATYVSSGIQGDLISGDKTINILNGAVVTSTLAGGNIYNSSYVYTTRPEGLTKIGSYYFNPSSTTATITVNVLNGGQAGTVVGSNYVFANAVSGSAGTDGYTKFVGNEKVIVNIAGEGTKVSSVYGAVYGAVNNSIEINISDGATVNNGIHGGSVGYRNKDNETANTSTFVNSTHIKISGEKTTVNGSVFGGGQGQLNSNNELYKNTNSDVKGNTIIEVTGGILNKNVYGGSEGGNVDGNAEIKLTGGHIAGNVYGGGIEGSVKNTYIVIDGATVDENVYGGGKDGGTVTESSTIHLLSGDVKGTVSGEGADKTSTVNGNKTLIVGSEEKAYIGTVGNIEGFDEILVSTGSVLNLTEGNAFTITEQNITLSESNLTQAAITTSTANVEAPLTLTLGFEGTLRSGKYMIISTEKPVEGWPPENVTVNGIAGFNDLKWEGNILSFVFQGGDADAMTTANWGVFKSTQAFTNVLWAPRAADSCLALPGQKDTMAWGSIYSHNSRIGSNGADYSIYGGAIGVEKGLKANRFIGAALGYDWGKVKPFSTTAVTQESFHLAGYGRAWHWCPNSTDAVSINWSAAYGRTTSEHSSIPGDWTQDNLQLDARATYYRALNNRTTVNGFVGAQYYAQDSDTTGAYKAKAMQNLRFMLGGGISYELTEKTTLYGEVALHQDVDRHNPSVSANGARFHCTNPGKFGCTVTGGAEYRINDSWSLRANYDFSTADDQTEHNINVGASYKF